MTPKRFALAALCLALAAPSVADAGLITWEFEGTIEQASPYAIPGGFLQLYAHELIPQLEAAGLTTGAAWRARISFESDTSAADCDDCAGYAEFIGTTRLVEFFSGSFAAASPDGAVGNAYSNSHGDGVGVGSDLAFLSLLVNDSTTLFAHSAALTLASLDPAALFSNSLPVDIPELSELLGPTVGAQGQLYGTRFNLGGHGFVRNSDTAILFGGPAFVSQTFAIEGRITSISPVPEPSLLTLVLAAAAASALRRRSRALP